MSHVNIEMLVVDDHASVRLLLELLAAEDSRYGAYTSAASGTPALELAEQGRPDVIVLDADLGGEDGLDLIPALRVVSPDSVIAVYSSAPLVTPQLSEKAGADVFVEKGTDLDVMFDQLAAMCRPLAS